MPKRGGEAEGKRLKVLGTAVLSGGKAILDKMFNNQCSVFKYVSTYGDHLRIDSWALNIDYFFS
jgi:hypothetical protein